MADPLTDLANISKLHYEPASIADAGGRSVSDTNTRTKSPGFHVHILHRDSPQHHEVLRFLQ